MVFAVMQTPTLGAAVRTTKEQSNVAAMGKFTITVLAMEMAQGCIGELLPMPSGEKPGRLRAIEVLNCIEPGKNDPWRHTRVFATGVSTAHEQITLHVIDDSTHHGS